MKEQLSAKKLQLYWIFLAFMVLLSSGCGQAIYQLTGAKTAKVENIATIEKFIQQQQIHFGPHWYFPKLPFDTLINKFPNEFTKNQFFDESGVEWQAKDGDQDPFHFLHHAKNNDSLKQYYTPIEQTTTALTTKLNSIQSFIGAPLQPTEFKKAKFTILFPWNKYLYKALYKWDLTEIEKILKHYPEKVNLHLINYDFNQTWGLPLGAKIPVKKRFNKSDRSLEATYNILPLLRKKG
jgi:hypothetical protein